ncbi:hypothetical protein [Thermococcus sp.]|uniref:hypothetical protein n=1 Tax=Thermococcus sp. TaxID=35749 RepID=UPI0026273D75|nr:hypothetical protein [Thermococcus sp.]
MSLENLYILARRELAKDLIFEVEGEQITISIRGVLIARTGSKAPNFSFFELSESDFVLAVQMRGFVVYLALESDGEVGEEAMPDLVALLLRGLTPAVATLVEAAEKSYRGSADILFDDMSSDLKEFLYDVLMKHRQGREVYEQTEIA